MLIQNETCRRPGQRMSQEGLPAVHGIDNETVELEQELQRQSQRPVIINEQNSGRFGGW